MMKSLERSSRCDLSCASCPALAWARWLSQVVKPEVRPPTTDPASAESAEMDATSILCTSVISLDFTTTAHRPNTSRLFTPCRSPRGSETETEQRESARRRKVRIEHDPVPLRAGVGNRKRVERLQRFVAFEQSDQGAAECEPFSDDSVV